MSGKNSKLIRRFCEVTKKRRRWVKRVWKDTKRPVRHELRASLWEDVRSLPY